MHGYLIRHLIILLHKSPPPFPPPFKSSPACKISGWMADVTSLNTLRFALRIHILPMRAERPYQIVETAHVPGSTHQTASSQPEHRNDAACSGDPAGPGQAAWYDHLCGGGTKQAACPFGGAHAQTGWAVGPCRPCLAALPVQPAHPKYPIPQVCPPTTPCLQTCAHDSFSPIQWPCWAA